MSIEITLSEPMRCQRAAGHYPTLQSIKSLVARLGNYIASCSECKTFSYVDDCYLELLAINKLLTLCYLIPHSLANGPTKRHRVTDEKSIIDFFGGK